MDWSLVLASQGIETTIQPPTDDHGWCLLVPSNETERAFKALRQYRVENRVWGPWRGELRWPAHVSFDWRSIGWAALLALFYWLSTVDSRFIAGGILDAEAVHAGQWWRVFTAMQLHADVAHLAANLSLGILLFGLTMSQTGAWAGLLLPYLAGAAGNLVTLLTNRQHFDGLGASGMVMGALGLLATQMIAVFWRNRSASKEAVAGLAAGIMLFALYGTAPGSDIAAHLGGFVAGAVLGVLLAVAPDNLRRNPALNASCGLILAGFVTLTWWLALRNLFKM